VDAEEASAGRSPNLEEQLVETWLVCARNVVKGIIGFQDILNCVQALNLQSFFFLVHAFPGDFLNQLAFKNVVQLPGMLFWFLLSIAMKNMKVDWDHSLM
jgi:hypothetical protein